MFYRLSLRNRRTQRITALYFLSLRSNKNQVRIVLQMSRSQIKNRIIRVLTSRISCDLKSVIYFVNFLNSSISCLVHLPGLPSPITLPSNLTTGIMSFVVTPKNSSSAIGCLFGRQRFFDNSQPDVFRRQLNVFTRYRRQYIGLKGEVRSLPLTIPKNAEDDPSVISPLSSTNTASQHPFLSASPLARTLGSKFSDFISHLFQRISGYVDTATPSFLSFGLSFSSIIVKKKFGFKSGRGQMVSFP